MALYGCVDNLNKNATASHSYIVIRLQQTPRKLFLTYAVHVDQYIKSGHPSCDRSMTCYGCIDDINKNATAPHSLICIQLQPMPRKYFPNYAVYVDQ